MMEPEEKEVAEAAESRPLRRQQTHAQCSRVGLIYVSNMRGFFSQMCLYYGDVAKYFG